MIIIGALLVTAASITFGTATIVVPPTEPEVWVNAAWAGSSYGQVVDEYGHVFGVNATDTISNGSHMVGPYGKINIAAGNYPENIVIDRALILNGSQSGMPGNDPSRGTGEVVIGGVSPAAGYTYGIEIQSSDVVVDGLTVTGHDIGIGTSEGSGPFNNVTIINNRVLNSANSGINVSAAGSKVEDNLVQGVISGTAIFVDAREGAATTVEGNVIKNFNNGIFYKGAGGIVRDNTLTSDLSYVYKGRVIDYQGDGGSLVGNTLDAENVGFAQGMIYYRGDDGLVSDNDLYALQSGYWTAGGHGTYSYFHAVNAIDYAGHGGNVSDNDVNIRDGTGPMVLYQGNGAIVTDNILATSNVGDRDKDSGDLRISYDIIKVDGDGALIRANYAYASYLSRDGIYYSGNGGMVSDNTIVKKRSTGLGKWVPENYAITCAGDAITVSENTITAQPEIEDLAFTAAAGDFSGMTAIGMTAIGSSIQSTVPTGSMLFYEGNAGDISDNVIGDANSEYDYGVYYLGDAGTLAGNTLNGKVNVNDVYYSGDNGRIYGGNFLNTTMISDNPYSVLYYTGDNGYIAGNTFNVTDTTGCVIDYDGGAFGVITGNVFTLHAFAREYAVGDDIIGYLGVNGNITNNVMQAAGIADNAIEYGDESMYLSSADAQQFPNYAGTIADNTLTTAFIDNGAFIEYFGDAGRIQRNKDLSPYEFMWPMVDYRAAAFGHGVITDNVGGAILYMGEMIPLAPYGTIANNHVNSSLIGIAAVGDYNVIRGNEINATIGTYTLGTKVLVESNDFTAIPQYIGPFYLSAGVLFDGDQCTVNDNMLNNFSFGAANVGLFKVVDIYTSGAVATEYTDQVNDSLDDSAVQIAALGGLAKGYVADKFASSGEGVSAKSAAALDSLGYRGYGNTISGNTLNYDDSLGIVGIVTLGYDFTVDSNTFNCVNDSSVLAGMIVGGDGGKVTNNEMSNISLLGMYYGGLLKFEDGLDGIYTSDLLGMNANISGNTIDNRGMESGGLFPWGIVFTGYDAAIEDNDLLGLGLGVLTVQFEGSITDNRIDTFNDDPMYLPLGATGVKPLEGEVVSGLGGIISVCNNLTVTDNFVNGTLMGMLFVPIDPYTTWGNAYVDNNVLNNNMFQMAFVPSYFMFHMEDGSVKPIDTATMLEVMDRNPMDRAVYDTNELGEFCVLPLIDTGYFDISAAGVYSDIQLGVLFAIIPDSDVSTVNVRPGTYSLHNPVIVPFDELNIVGDVNAPATTVVETGGMPFLARDKNAFEVMADNVTIKGFAIRNSNNTLEDKNYGNNSGISVGWTGLSSTSIAATPYMVYGGAFENNTFTNLTTGIYLDSSRNASIRYNLFDGNNVGVNLTMFCSPNTTEIHYNDFVDNAGYAVNNRNSLVRPESLATISINPWVNATYNWWNSYQGPHDVTDPASTSTGDNVTYFVIYDPWLTTPMFSTLYTYHLVPGWNLIAVPLDVPDTSLTGFFPADVKSGITEMWGWNTSTQNWMFYGPDPNDYFYTVYPKLIGVETGRGYWVNMSKEAYFVVEGSVPASAPRSPAALVDGWNLLGITGDCPVATQDLYADSPEVWGWNESVQNWQFYGSDPNDYFYTVYPKLNTLNPGHGHWVKVVAA